MTARRPTPRTADLFAAATAPELAAAPEPAAAPELAPAPRATRGASTSTGGLPPAPRTAARRCSRQLWHAVVFPSLRERETPQAAETLQRLARQAQRFTPFVSIEPPDALLLEIKGSLKLFGSLERLRADIDAGWRRLGVMSAGATAPSTLAALWCARAGRALCSEDPGALAGHLAELPIACTAWDAGRLQTLRAMGVTRLGELLRLPRAGLARRLGVAAVLDLDIALARQAAPRRAYVPQQRFRERCDFETEIEHVAYLERALAPLLERCADFLRERQAGVQALQLELRHRAGPPTRVHLGLASVTGEQRRLSGVLTEQLARLVLAAPVRGVELVSGPLRALSADSLDAFAGRAGAGGRDTAPQLVERLRARLGERAVYGVCSIAEHRPEAACRRVHELRLGTAASVAEKMSDAGRSDVDGSDVAGAAQAMPRPVWLLAEPVLLSGREAPSSAADAPLSAADAPSSAAEVPLSAAGLRLLQQGALILEQGPERIESGWWDGKGVARDYYTAREAEGARLWVFQERHSRRWYLHGVFA